MDGKYYRQLYRDRIRSEYSGLLIEIAKKETEITKLKKKAKEIENLLLSDDRDQEHDNDLVEAELEGGGSFWWHVCGDCHGTIDENDEYCRHCGRRIRHG